MNRKAKSLAPPGFWTVVVVEETAMVGELWLPGTATMEVAEEAGGLYFQNICFWKRDSPCITASQSY